LGLTALLKQSAAVATDNKVPERSYRREKALQRYALDAGGHISRVTLVGVLAISIC